MTGSVVRRGEKRYAIVLERGYTTDPDTGKRKRDQKWTAFEFQGGLADATDAQVRKAAERELYRLLDDDENGQAVDPSKLTVGQHFHDWVETVVKESDRSLRTYEAYKQITTVIGKSFLAHVLLQKLRAPQLRKFYRDLDLAVVTKKKYHAVIHGGLESALKDRLVKYNVASKLDGKPKRPKGQHDDILAQSWDEAETAAVLAVAETWDPQSDALYQLAIDSGMRKAELCGLRWTDILVESCEVRVARQLLKGARRYGKQPPREPLFGPTKNGKPRTIDVSPKTMHKLVHHKQLQAAFKMKHRPTYHDYDLVFAKHAVGRVRRHNVYGDPLDMNMRDFDVLIAKAKVKRITFHGMRHTCATLLLGKLKVPVKVVSERLGHASVEITLSIYQHVLPGMQKEAATQLSDLLARAGSR